MAAGISSKYGEVTVSKGSFLPGEPVFIIRAKDLLAPEALAAYVRACERADEMVEPIHTADVREEFKLFVEWRIANPDQIKVPDSREAA